MADSLKTSIETWQMYWGDGYIGWLFAACLAVLAVLSVKNRKLIPAVLVSGAVTVLFFVPVTERMMSKLSQESVYWRLLWVCPCFLVIGLTITTLIRKLPRWWMRLTALIPACLLIILCSRGQSAAGSFEKPSNKEQVPSLVASVADCILADLPEGSCAATDDLIASYLRVYAPQIRMPYGRRADGRKNREALQLYQYIAFPETYIASIPELARIAGATHVVMQASFPEAEEVMKAANWEKLADFETYSVYRAVS